ncbi:MAG: VWA domain-containing protein [Acidobacteria bacterium]|nr:VWA domain-containing protein [Acidobacteriota bacterium]MBA3886250.1 VWA domain-containing protein [Acidobacteriota bacterium]
MKPWTFSLLTLALTGALLVTPLPAQQQPFRTGANTVAVYATVSDGQGRLVPDLERDHFQIRDNGKPQPITVFSNDIQPISVVMMLDRSGSMRQNFRLLEAGAEAFVRRLRPEDKARIGSFAERIQIDPEGFTNDQDELIRIIRHELQDQGPTPLWNALDAAITALSDQEGRRVVLVFSDGGDFPMNFRLRNRSIMDVMRRSHEENVMVYAIGLQSTTLRQPGRGGLGGFGGGMRSERPDPGLATIADETGGGYFELNRAEDLASTFARVADELHRQYLIGFEPPALDNKMHKLQVRVTERGMKVRARREYFAAR